MHLATSHHLYTSSAFDYCCLSTQYDRGEVCQIQSGSSIFLSHAKVPLARGEFSQGVVMMLYIQNWQPRINIGEPVLTEKCGVFQICFIQKQVNTENFTIMKTSLLSIRTSSFLVVLLLTLMALSINAQNTQKGFSFQGFARDFDGAAYSSSNITAQFTISPSGEATVAYTETQSLTTDAYGVFNAIIGAEAPVDFAALDFSAKNYKMKVEVKVTGGDYVTISDSELLAVPYAKAANRAVRADNGTPPGTVISFAGANAPAGYLVCDGSTVSSTTYPELYAAIGTLWGGDATNFNLPDLRGQFLRGQDDGAGVDPDAADRVDSDGNTVGDVVGSYQEDTFQDHAHGFGAEGCCGSGRATLFLGGADDAFVNGFTTWETSTVLSDPAIRSNELESRSKNAYVLYVIKY